MTTATQSTNTNIPSDPDTAEKLEAKVLRMETSLRGKFYNMSLGIFRTNKKHKKSLHLQMKKFLKLICSCEEYPFCRNQDLSIFG